MKARAFVLIFFFWALLTIITPTLVRLSESSKTDLDQNGKVSDGMKPRKMMTYSEKHPAKTMMPMSPLPAPAPTPAPAPIDQLAFSIEMITRKQQDRSSDNIMRLIRASLSKSSQVTV